MRFELMKEFMDRLTSWRIPGNSISVYYKGTEVFNYQSGFENVEKQIPMNGSELFNIYSCSKPVTVTAALQLYERGLFLLDDPLYDFIPEYRSMNVRDKNGNIDKAKNVITIRNLFTMTSGLDYGITDEMKAEVSAKTNGRMDTLAVVREMANKTLDFEPGDNWLYGYSHDVLAGVVEVISGMKFRDYVKKNIFEPLGMNNSYYHKEGIEDKIAQQYRFINSDENDLVKLQTSAGNQTEGYINNVGINNGFVFGAEYDSGGAGIITSVSDYVKFCSALANFGTGLNGEKILADGTVELLRTNQLDEKQNRMFSSYKQWKGYGYGLGVRTLTDKAVSGSTGNLKEYGWGGAAGATVLIDSDINLAMFYTHHMLNPQEEYYQPRLRNVLYSCIN